MEGACMSRVDEIYSLLLSSPSGSLSVEEVAYSLGISIQSALVYFSKVAEKYPAVREGSKLILRSCLCLEGKEASRWLRATAKHLGIDLNEVVNFRYYGDEILVTLTDGRVREVRFEDIEDIYYCLIDWREEITTTEAAIWRKLCIIEDREKRRELHRKIEDMIDELEDLYTTDRVSWWVDWIVVHDGWVEFEMPKRAEDTMFLDESEETIENVVREAEKIYKKYFPS